MDYIGWNMIVAFSTVYGLFMAVGKPILNLNKTINELIIRMNSVEEKVTALTLKNDDSHQHIHQRIDNTEKRLNELDNKYIQVSTIVTAKKN